MKKRTRREEGENAREQGEEEEVEKEEEEEDVGGVNQCCRVMRKKTPFQKKPHLLMVSLRQQRSGASSTLFQSPIVG